MEAKKSTAKKAAPKAAAKKPAAKAAPKKAAPKKAVEPQAAAAPKKAMPTPEERYRMIQEAAYFVAERHGFTGDSAYFWSLAEAEIDAHL